MRSSNTNLLPTMIEIGRKIHLGHVANQKLRENAPILRIYAKQLPSSMEDVEAIEMTKWKTKTDRGEQWETKKLLVTMDRKITHIEAC